MTSNQERFRVAVLDDYHNVALSLADWSVLDARATVTVFNDHVADTDAVVARLQPFDIVCVMRERTPMTRSIIERLPKIRIIASTATRNASIDLNPKEMASAPLSPWLTALGERGNTVSSVSPRHSARRGSSYLCTIIAISG